MSKTTAQLDAEIAESLLAAEHAAKPSERAITGELARRMPRFEFIAHWLATVTRKKANRGRLGLYVRKVRKEWRVYSPIEGGTIMYRTSDPSMLFDYARRTQLGPEIRKAEEFRGEAFGPQPHHHP